MLEFPPSRLKSNLLSTSSNMVFKGVYEHIQFHIKNHTIYNEKRPSKSGKKLYFLK